MMKNTKKIAFISVILTSFLSVCIVAARHIDPLEREALKKKQIKEMAYQLVVYKELTTKKDELVNAISSGDFDFVKNFLGKTPKDYFVESTKNVAFSDFEDTTKDYKFLKKHLDQRMYLLPNYIKQNIQKKIKTLVTENEKNEENEQDYFQYGYSLIGTTLEGYEQSLYPVSPLIKSLNRYSSEEDIANYKRNIEYDEDDAERLKTIRDFLNYKDVLDLLSLKVPKDNEEMGLQEKGIFIDELKELYCLSVEFLIKKADVFFGLTGIYNYEVLTTVMPNVNDISKTNDGFVEGIEKKRKNKNELTSANYLAIAKSFIDYGVDKDIKSCFFYKFNPKGIESSLKNKTQNFTEMQTIIQDIELKKNEGMNLDKKNHDMLKRTPEYLLNRSKRTSVLLSFFKSINILSETESDIPKEKDLKKPKEEEVNKAFDNVIKNKIADKRKNQLEMILAKNDFSKEDEELILSSMDILCDYLDLSQYGSKIDKFLFQEMPGLNQTCLHRVAQSGNQMNLNYLQKNLSAQLQDSINKKDILGMTPIHWAVAGSQRQIFNFLLTVKGVDINISNLKNESPLFTSITRHDREVVMILIKNGANLKEKDEGGDGYKILEVAIGSGDIELAKDLNTIIMTSK